MRRNYLLKVVDPSGFQNCLAVFSADALEIPLKIQRNVGHCPHPRAVQVSLQVATEYGLRDTIHAVAPMNTTVAPEQILLNSGENRCFYQ